MPHTCYGGKEGCNYTFMTSTIDRVRNGGLYTLESDLNSSPGSGTQQMNKFWESYLTTVNLSTLP